MEYFKARREAIVAFVILAVACAWTLSVSFYLSRSEPLETVLGIPKWVVWGVFVPWVVFFLVHCWYTLSFQRMRGK